MSVKYQTTSLIIMLGLLLFSCSPNKSLFKRYGEITPVSTKENAKFASWQNFYFSPEDCKCVNGGAYFIAIKDAPSQTGNLMISLQGGGACWPGLLRCKQTTIENDVRISNFTSQLDERLAEDWNKVVIPYCDGSIYMGDSEKDYDSDYEIDHWHNGLKISVAAIKLVKEKYPNISIIFLTGCSAGGYGTIIQLRLIRELYPKTSIFVLNESGPGLLRPDQKFWEMIVKSWNFNQLVPKNCEKCKGQLIYWYQDMLKDPKIKIGLYSAYMDEVIGQKFLNLEPEGYKSLLLSTSDDLNSKYPNQFKRFFINGNSHCVKDRDYQVNGIKYWDWVLAFINEQENWKDILE
ncbi:pectin acetylesterase-family hydrolase [Flexithrix dorotheae]|uniref:pectin acetylesterase-family hydrolase n=1 Tax=Flexithrix dorotheae TaxID=70993 RepID=UPI000362457A|nr:pectin acetylesterase-family hydrolase [Flexithrix dorotheae]